VCRRLCLASRTSRASSGAAIDAPASFAAPLGDGEDSSWRGAYTRPRSRSTAPRRGRKAACRLPRLGWPPTGSAVERHRSRAGHGPAVRALRARNSGGRLSPLMMAGPAAAWQAPRASRAAAARCASDGAAADSVMIATRVYASYELATGLEPLVGPSRSIWLSWVRATRSRALSTWGVEYHRNRSTYRSCGCEPCRKVFKRALVVY